MPRKRTVNFDPKNTEKAEPASPNSEAIDAYADAFSSLPDSQEMILWREVFLADYLRRRNVSGAAEEANKAAVHFRNFIDRLEDEAS